MHPTAMLHARSFFRTYAGAFASGTIVEIGSQDVNGSLREVAPKHLKYTGVDFVTGKGVDVVLDDPYQLPFETGSVDIVVTSSCFEHSEMFWLLFLEVLRILKPNGLLYLNAPSNGDYHRWPVDCWRFYPDSGQGLVTWAVRSGMKPQLLESFIGGKQMGVWNDFVAVFVKDEAHAGQHTRRMVDSGLAYTNARLLGRPDPVRHQQVSPDQRGWLGDLKRWYWTRSEGKVMKRIRREGP